MNKVFENLNLQDLDGEVWKTVEEYPDYQVSNLGRIKSFKKWNGTSSRILSQCKDGGGHFHVVLCKNGISKPKRVHRLVFETFIGEITEGFNVHHIDGYKENNNLDNFKLMSESEHRSLHMKGKHHSIESKNKISESMKGKNHTEETKIKMSEKKIGEKHPNFKMTNQKIIDIQIDIEKGDLTQSIIAEKYGFSKSTISNIKTGKLTIR